MVAGGDGRWNSNGKAEEQEEQGVKEGDLLYLL